MPLRLYNTLTRRKEDFVPRKAGQVSLYTCGPTVYGPAHIGNLRTYVFEDVLKRWLTHGHKLKVKQVMNITDVEDKIIANSEAATVAEMAAYTKPFEQRFHADLAALNVTPADSLPRATEYIPQMIAMVEGLITSGFAYERDGSVYFDISAYRKKHTYGQLLHIDVSGFKPTERVKADEYDKDSPTDFALWKAEEHGKPGWDSPWGYGRPGWHLECSVMVKQELGETIDIHTGAVDLKFPHHENEIAQSQAANDAPLARTWLHAEHLLVDGARMAKSAGNFYTLGDVAAKGFDPVVLRLLFLGAHYRSKLNFTWESLADKKATWLHLEEVYRRIKNAYPNPASVQNEITHELLKRADEDFSKAMDEDLNTPKALAVVFDLSRELNRSIAQSGVAKEIITTAVKKYEYFLTVLGLPLPVIIKEKIPQHIQAIVNQRQAARDSGDFAASDQLRQQIVAAGYEVEDTASGQRVRKAA